MPIPTKNRADRLAELRGLLLRGGASLTEICRRFCISPRTVQRDLEELSQGQGLELTEVRFLTASEDVITKVRELLSPD